MIPTVPLGGIFQQHQAAALCSAGLKVGIASGGLLPFRDLLTFSGRPVLERKEKSVIVRRFKKSFLPLRFISAKCIHEENIKNLIRSIETYIQLEGRPDCIHSHNLQYAAIAGYHISVNLGIPLVLTEHSSSFLTNSFPQDLYNDFKKVADHAATNIAVSTSLADNLNNLLSPQKKPFIVVPNVIDFNLPCSSQEKNSSFTFLSIGRLDANKNHQLLIRAFAKAFQGAKAVLRIGGAGDEEPHLRKLAKALSIEDQITFLGFLTRDQVARELSFAHCFVLSSLKETFGVVVVEALSNGLPVVSTPSGGPRDILNEFNGIITADHSVECLCDALLNIHDQFSKFDSSRIKREAFSRFSSESFSESMVSIYQAAVESRMR